MVTVFTLTPAAVAQALRDEGLDALGLTVPRLSNSWGGATPAYDAATLRLTPAGPVLAPFRGTLEFLDSGAEFRDVAGAPIAGPVAAYRLHPQAVQRLDRLLAARFAPPGHPHHRLVPETLVFTGAAQDRSPQTYEPGESLGRAEPMSFHDNRGLIVDPVAVAALLADLIGAFPALDASGGGPLGGAGGLATIAALAAGVLVQVNDLHGRPFAALPGGPGVEKRDAGAAPAGAPGANGLLTLAAGETLAGTGAGAAARLRLGWATGGVMGAGPLAQPAAAVALPARTFLRAFATDLDWHLRGNRSAGAVRGVPAEDGRMPADLTPTVRDNVTVDYPADGPDLLAEAGQVLGRLTGAAGAPLVFAVAPAISAGLGLPPTPGAAAHWPGFPAPDTAAGFAAGASQPLTGATAVWTAGEDVVLTLPANAIPDGASVRVFPQRFQLIESIGEAPSFLRGDGGGAVAAAGQPTAILVANPFGLPAGDPKPNPAVMVFDLVVTPRRGRRRMFANRRLTVAAGPAPAPADGFAAPDPMTPIPLAVKSVAPAPLFGLPRTAAPPGGLVNPIDIVRALGSETEPRQGPRHPTMGRHEMIVATGIGNAAQLDDGLDWDGVLSGARWTRETRSAALPDGNPGNPTGPDTHAGGVRATGALAYDLARLAVRRVQPMLPLPGGAAAATSPGWIVMSGGNNMNPPVPDPVTPPQGGTSAGVVLQTVAAVAETPELSLIPDGTPLTAGGPITFDGVLDAIAGALGIPSPAGAVAVANEDRLINEVRREVFLARNGARDALWSLARALTEAEELVYIETAGFARTARPGGAPAAHEIDLVALLAQRMAARPGLKAIVCTPRESDFAPAPFARRAFQQRKEALDMLEAAAPGRVAAFHPRGFPGRGAAIRTTAVIVDDVWSLTGATHFRRRGMTFDGSAAIASVDRDIDAGYSRKVRDQRVALMLAKLGAAPVDAAGLPAAEAIRLHRPAGAFALVRDLLAQGGLGVIQPLWLGPQDATVLPQSDAVADPDGANGAPAGLGLAAFLSEA
jgi:hypothetical protein